MSAISVVIADRGKAGRAACRSLLEVERGIRVVGEARSGPDAVTAAEKLRPSVLLLDLASFSADGATLLPVIRRKSPNTRVLLLTSDGAKPRTLDALAHGARGYLEKAALRAYLPRAVRAIDAGEAWVPRKMVAKIISELTRMTIPAK
jgi:DNA-binding NarL/FixJ family response regulator